MPKEILYIIGVIFLIFVIYVISVVNSLKKAKNKVKEAYVTMDVYMKKKWNLIPSLVEIVKPYSKQELSTLEEVIRLRNTTYNNMDNEKRVNVLEEITPRIKKLMSLAIEYPELKANDNYLKLETSLAQLENEITNARIIYNDRVKKLNNMVYQFPSNIVAKALKIVQEKSYPTEDSKKGNITIDLKK